MVLRRSLTPLELALAAVVLGVTVAVLIDRALGVMELAERTAMEATVSNLSSGVNARFAFEILKGSKPEGWERRDPFDLANMAAPSTDWHWDPEHQEVLYRPRLRRQLRTAEPGAPLRFRLVPRGSGFGYLLEPVSRYEWTSTAVQVLPSVHDQGRCFS